LNIRILAGFITAILLFASASIVWIFLQASRLLNFEWTLILTMITALSPSYILFKPILNILSEKRLPSPSPQQMPEVLQLREFASSTEKQLNETRKDLEDIKIALQKIQEGLSSKAETAKTISKIEPPSLAVPPPEQRSEPQVSHGHPTSSAQSKRASRNSELGDEIRSLIEQIRKIKKNLEGPSPRDPRLAGPQESLHGLKR